MAAGKEREAASFAATLAANIQSLMPEEPEMATVIMDAMATSFADAWEEADKYKMKGNTEK